jgi:hypothetical protein
MHAMEQPPLEQRARRVEQPLEERTPRVAWIELTCLNCGEIAGYIEDRRFVRGVVPGRVRLDGKRLRCGRCGGLLLTGDHGLSTISGG